MNRLLSTVIFSFTVSIMSVSAFPIIGLIADAEDGFKIAKFDTVSGSDLGIADGESAEDIKSIVVKVINVFLGFIALVAVIVIIIAGVQYITSRGDEGQVETAKHTIMYAAIGLLVVGLAAAIVNFVITAFE
ncbi:MAG: hypothetical protein HYR90_00240 [Candidatus Andersenbacteria bacterium]|nr:hypothetical protein [Candidatus Andersenbacteria bacterium]MBI3250668.1 hypothetical protein [Candidatus Andersenbacteria bacterium]